MREGGWDEANEMAFRLQRTIAHFLTEGVPSKVVTKECKICQIVGVFPRLVGSDAKTWVRVARSPEG